MAASRITIEELVAAIRSWQRDFAISDAAISLLLLRLVKVEGNKSFQETLAKIAEVYRRES